MKTALLAQALLPTNALLALVHSISHPSSLNVYLSVFLATILLLKTNAIFVTTPVSLVLALTQLTVAPALLLLS